MADENVINDSSGDSGALAGTDGDDTFVFAPGNGDDTITGFTDGQDLIDLSAFPTISNFYDLRFNWDETGVTIDLTAHGGGTIFLEGFSINNLSSRDFVFRVDQTLTGGSGDDTLTGATGDDTIKGQGGDDTLDGGAGIDWIEGGAGDDALTGGSQADMFVFGPGNGSDTITDFVPGEDRINLTGYSGITGFDDLAITETDGGVTIDLSAYGGGSIKLEGLSAGDLDAGDFLLADGWEYGTDAAETIRGTADADAIDALGGDDRVFGNGGDDSLSGGAGTDAIFGGDGDDTIDGGDGDDTLFGGEDNDTIFGGAGVDGITGDAGDDTIYGGADNDTLNGGAGDDTLHGDAGGDALYGQDGDDRLFGGAGDDRLYGGDGDDTFVFAAGDGNDTVIDFDATGGDAIDLSAFTGVTGFGDLTINAEAGGAVIDLTSQGGGRIRLVDVDADDLDAADFHFHDSSADPAVDGI
ncbi:MAG: calcium-binding protein [Nitrospinae bacterium]|nr:calcium-binding protein [Nitrospinota bacterium]